MKKPFLGAKDVVAETPSIVMYDPRDSHNVGAAVRACSCFGVKQVWLTGRRTADQVWKAKRIPREERMKGFKDVQLVLEDRPFEGVHSGGGGVVKRCREHAWLRTPGEPGLHLRA